MIIQTPTPETTPVTLRDLDISLGGVVQSLTLRPDDALSVDSNGDVVVKFSARPETVVFRAAHIQWYSARERIVNEKVEAGHEVTT